MGDGAEKVLDEAIKDPETIYKIPAEVLSDTRLTQKQKDKILHSWELDQLALLRAEDENMRQKTNTPPPVDLFEKIKKAEKSLHDAPKMGGKYEKNTD